MNSSRVMVWGARFVPGQKEHRRLQTLEISTYTLRNRFTESLPFLLFRYYSMLLWGIPHQLCGGGNIIVILYDSLRSRDKCTPQNDEMLH